MREVIAAAETAADFDLLCGGKGAVGPSGSGRLADSGCRTRASLPNLVCANGTTRSFMFYLAGTSIGPPLSFTRNTTNFAGCVLLALRPMT